MTYFNNLEDAHKHIAELEDYLTRVLVGGNHLASYLLRVLGGNEDSFPPYRTRFKKAQQILSPDVYEAWACWAILMRVRDKVEQLKTEESPNG